MLHGCFTLFLDAGPTTAKPGGLSPPQHDSYGTGALVQPRVRITDYIRFKSVPVNWKRAEYSEVGHQPMHDNAARVDLSSKE